MAVKETFIIIFLLLLANVIEISAPNVRSKCADIVPDDYDNMHAPQNMSQTHLQATVFNIGDIGLHDQVTRSSFTLI